MVGGGDGKDRPRVEYQPGAVTLEVNKHLVALPETQSQASVHIGTTLDKNGAVDDDPGPKTRYKKQVSKTLMRSVPWLAWRLLIVQCC